MGTSAAAVLGIVLAQMTVQTGGRTLPSEGGFRTGMLLGCGVALAAAAIAAAVLLRKDTRPEGTDPAPAPLPADRPRRARANPPPPTDRWRTHMTTGPAPAAPAAGTPGFPGPGPGPGQLVITRDARRHQAIHGLYGLPVTRRPAPPVPDARDHHLGHSRKKTSMSAPHTPPGPRAIDAGDLGFDPDELRARYRAERERRIRPEGSKQYRRATGEFGYYADDPYADASRTREPLHDRVEVVIVGGGFGGLLAGARLRQAGVESVRVIEKGGDFGGTWYWNRYPGIHCDIESYIYMPLLEEVGYVPRWKYAPGEEIRRHAQAIGRTFDLYRDACFQTRVTELRWDETASEWIVSTDSGDRIRTRFVVTASGTLSEAKLPGIPGIETFQGHTFHTSRWDYDYTGGDADGDLHKLADKRVALIGTGATAIQCVPHLGADARQLYVFQRTPSSVDVRGNRPTDPAWAESLTPGWQRRRRDNFLTLVTGGQAEEDLIDDGWTHTARLQQKLIPTDSYQDLPPEERERAYELADFQKMNEIRARVDAIVEDPATAELLKPWYRYMCKRPTFSDSYLQTFNRPNVTVVDTAGSHGVERVTESAVVAGGHAYEVDCVIFATGFEVGASGILSGRLPVHGRGGVTLTEAWKGGPRTLHGFYAHGFPNLFQLGPLQNASSVNFVHVLDEQATHVAAVVGAARQHNARYVEPTPEAEAAWVATIRQKAADLYRFQAECTPGYYNNEGMPRQRSESYGDGPAAFHSLLREWRANGGLRDVLVTTGEDTA